MFGPSSIPRTFATPTCAWIRILLFLGLAPLFGGCSSLAPRDFAAGTPVFDPLVFFTGKTHSWGVFENRVGAPTRRFTTACAGNWDGSVLVLAQTFTYEDGKTQHRQWRIRHLDAHRYEATANDVAGVAAGEAHGNAFHWKYTVELKPGNPIFNVQLEQWMYLQADGTVLNRGSIKKSGVLVAQVTEHFQRGEARTRNSGL